MVASTLIGVTLPVVEKPNVPTVRVATTLDGVTKVVEVTVADPTDVVPDTEPSATTAVLTTESEPITLTILVAFVPDTRVTALQTTDTFPKLIELDTPEIPTIVLAEPTPEKESWLKVTAPNEIYILFN